MAELNISIIKKSVEEALNEPFKDGKSILQWAEIGIHSQERSQWISVKKKLPEQAGYSCLVSAEYGDGKRAEFIAFTGYGESEWYTYDALFMEKEREADNRVHHNYHITHWIPLPEPPKEVKP